MKLEITDRDLANRPARHPVAAPPGIAQEAWRPDADYGLRWGLAALHAACRRTWHGSVTRLSPTLARYEYVVAFEGGSPIGPRSHIALELPAAVAQWLADAERAGAPAAVSFDLPDRAPMTFEGRAADLAALAE